MFGLAVWVLLSLLGGFLTLSAVWAHQITRWRLLSFLGLFMWILVSGGGLLVSQGWATQCSLLLPGKYNILGYLPEPESRIYLFLGTEYGPKICYVPWNPAEADKLKEGEEDGSEFEISWGPPGEGGSGVPGFNNGGEINTRPPADNHKPKPEEDLING